MNQTSPPISPDVAPTDDAPATPVAAEATTAPASRRRFLALVGAGSAVAFLTPFAVTRWDDAVAAATDALGSGATTTGGGATASFSGSGTFLSADALHELTVAMDTTAFEAAVTAYRDNGEKNWVEVDITLDGTTYARSGIRLKGNSTLKRTDSSAGAQEYPWLVRLDKYVDGQNHDGLTELAIRTNNSTSALNEAVALDLMAAAGLVTQGHAYAAVRFGDSTPALRLVVEHPGDSWVDNAIDRQGILYKAEATGDYTYRGTDPAAYDNVFDQESGETDDLTPLIEFLDFVNNSSDAEFADGIASRLDVASFATYLAFEDLVDNYDAIDGPGNNSYLWWDVEAKKMTVVGWDHNLTFGVSNRPGAGGGGGMPDGAMPGGGQPPAGGGGMGGPGRNNNPLVTRFEGLSARAAEVTAASTRLRSELYTSGVAEKSLTTWSTLLTSQAGDLIDASTVATEGDAIKAYFS